MVSTRPGATGTLERLEGWLAASGFAPGDRLPAERHLSDTLKVTRAEIRKALAVLEARGALQRRVGHGTYLTSMPEPETGGLPSSPGDVSISALVRSTSPHDAMMARLALEPTLAGLAAIHATPVQITSARRLADNMRAALGWEHYHHLDEEFHKAIADAAGNSLLTELHRILNAVRVSVVWPRLDVPADRPPKDYHSFAEHEAILDALDRRDRIGATDAMRAHLRSTLGTLVAET